MDIEKFLLNPDVNDLVFEGTYNHQKIHKEKFDDRFVVIYTKTNNSYLSQNDYEVAGYLDTKDRVLYNCTYYLNELLPKEKNLIEKSSFGVLGEKLWNEIQDYIEKYSFANEEKLKDIAIEKYNHLEDYRIDSYKRDVREQFVEEMNPIIKLQKSYSSYEFTNIPEYKGHYIDVEYLNNPQKTVEKYSNKIIETIDDYRNNKEELGLELLIFRDKIEYLDIIKENKNNEFKDLYIKRNIYNSIKDIDAKTVNITIQYGDKSLTFKYEYSALKRDLTNDSKGSSGYGKAYEEVSKFIKENSQEETSRWTEEFNFSNITSITYGKNELYHYDLSSSKDKEVEEDLEIEI
ncbi:MAG: hypothetical protein IJ565_05980 [Bacilli bacterium]|nr:hypothetical protein [Bacilli bacterium]